MAAEISAQTFIDNLINSRNRDISLFLPFILGLNPTSPPQETEDQDHTPTQPDRIILINPFTQGMVVIERGTSNNSSSSSSLGFESLFGGELFSGKTGSRHASKASIDAMTSVEIGGDCDDEQCVVCLEEWECGERAKEMPCKHGFHGECIEKWLRIHGSCPVCRYQMPVDDENDGDKKSGEGDGERRREIWVSFSLGVEKMMVVRVSGGDSFASDQEI